MGSETARVPESHDHLNNSLVRFIRSIVFGSSMVIISGSYIGKAADLSMVILNNNL